MIHWQQIDPILHLWSGRTYSPPLDPSLDLHSCKLCIYLSIHSHSCNLVRSIESPEKLHLHHMTLEQSSTHSAVTIANQHSSAAARGRACENSKSNLVANLHMDTHLIVAEAVSRGRIIPCVNWRITTPGQQLSVHQLRSAISCYSHQNGTSTVKGLEGWDGAMQCFWRLHWSAQLAWSLTLKAYVLPVIRPRTTCAGVCPVCASATAVKRLQPAIIWLWWE